MKRNIIFFVLILSTTLYSCSKVETPNYSCDPIVNNWIIENKTDLNNISREQLISLPINYQIPIYRSLSKDKKQELWKTKIDLIITESDVYNEETLNLIETFARSLSSEMFSPEQNEYAKSLADKFIANIFELNPFVDSLSIVIDFASLYTYSELENYLHTNIVPDYSWLPGSIDVRGPIGPSPDCLCRWSLTCSTLNMGHCDENKPCLPTDGGCGFMFLYPCTGRCSGEVSLD